MSNKQTSPAYGLQFFINDHIYVAIEGDKVIHCDKQRYDRRIVEMSIPTARKALAALSSLLAAHDGQPCDPSVRVVNWELKNATIAAEQAEKAARDAAERLAEVSARVAVQFAAIKEGKGAGNG